MIIGGKTSSSRSAVTSVLGDSGFNLSSVDNNYIFCELKTTSTLENGSQILFTWHSRACTTFKRLRWVRRYMHYATPSQVRLKSGASLSDDNPFNFSAYDTKNISCGNGDLYQEYVDEGYYVTVAVGWIRDDGGGAITYVTVGRTNSYTTNDTPTLSYNSQAKEFSITTSTSSQYIGKILEFRNTSHDIGYPTNIHDEEILNSMYYSAVVNMEYGLQNDKAFAGYYRYNYGLLRWAPGSYKVAVDFRSTQNSSTISIAINSALQQINGVMNTFGVYFSRDDSSYSSAAMKIVVDTEENLFEITPDADEHTGGTWVTDYDTSGINLAYIKLACDYYDYVPYMPYKNVVFEEMFQTMGAGYDQVEYPFNTVHCEMGYYNKPDYVTDKDNKILQLVYSQYVAHQDDYTSVGLKLNIPRGFKYIDFSDATVSAAFLKSGTYRARAFMVNIHGERSQFSDWVIVENSRPENWNWRASNGSATATQTQDAHKAVTKVAGYTTQDFSYKVWNDLIDKVKEFLEYKGVATQTISEQKYGYPIGTSLLTMADGAKMSGSGQIMTANMFNAVRFCIGSMNATGLSDFSKGDSMKGEYFTTLTTKLNAIT